MFESCGVQFSIAVVHFVGGGYQNYTENVIGVLNEVFWNDSI